MKVVYLMEGIAIEPIRGCTVSDLSVFGSVRFSNFGFGSVQFLD